MSIEPISNVMPYQATPQVTPVATQAQTQEDAAAKTVISETEAAAEPVVAEAAEANEENAAGQGSQEKSEGSNDQVRKAVEQLNKKMVNQNSEAVFGIHEKTNRVTIKIVDKTSKKVIKELPPEKTLDMIAKVWEMAGILVDEKK